MGNAMGNAMGNIMGGVGGIGGIQNNPLGGIGSIGGFGRSSNGNGADNVIGGGVIDNTGGLLANPVLSGFPTGLQGGFQGSGLAMGMGGMGKFERHFFVAPSCIVPRSISSMRSSLVLLVMVD
jgi:hypothetical protein